MDKKVLVVGNGFLGNSIINEGQKKEFQIISAHTSSNNHPLDIRKNESIEKVVIKTSPTVIINCAALTNVDEIEKNPKEAYSVNSLGAKNLAKISKNYGIKFIQISTDSVFDGKRGNYSETDTTNPINEYAKSKKLGEDYTLDENSESTVVRTNFYGENKDGKFLYNWILNNLKNNKTFSGFNNIIFNPLEIQNLTNMLLEISEIKYAGIIHLASDNFFSKYQFAQKIAIKLGYDEKLIKKGLLDNNEMTAKRPLNTTLSNEIAKKILKIKPISLEQWLHSEYQ
jgi:dTDP-4-dehydrorhamnose reductase